MAPSIELEGTFNKDIAYTSMGRMWGERIDCRALGGKATAEMLLSLVTETLGERFL